MSRLVQFIPTNSCEAPTLLLALRTTYFRHFCVRNFSISRIFWWNASNILTWHANCIRLKVNLMNSINGCVPPVHMVERKNVKKCWEKHIYGPTVTHEMAGVCPMSSHVSRRDDGHTEYGERVTINIRVVLMCSCGAGYGAGPPSNVAHMNFWFAHCLIAAMAGEYTWQRIGIFNNRGVVGHIEPDWIIQYGQCWYIYLEVILWVNCDYEFDYLPSFFVARACPLSLSFCFCVSFVWQQIRSIIHHPSRFSIFAHSMDCRSPCLILIITMTECVSCAMTSFQWWELGGLLLILRPTCPAEKQTPNVAGSINHGNIGAVRNLSANQ